VGNIADMDIGGFKVGNIADMDIGDLRWVTFIL